MQTIVLIAAMVLGAPGDVTYVRAYPAHEMTAGQLTAARNFALERWPEITGGSLAGLSCWPSGADIMCHASRRTTAPIATYAAAAIIDPSIAATVYAATATDVSWTTPATEVALAAGQQTTIGNAVNAMWPGFGGVAALDRMDCSGPSGGPYNCTARGTVTADAATFAADALAGYVYRVISQE